MIEQRLSQMWKRALKKLQSVDLDPWLDFQTHQIPAQTAIRHRYSVIKKKWVVDEIVIKIENDPFDRGAMRECFRLKKLPQSGSHVNDWQYASNYVAKRYINNVDKQVYFDDVRLQMEAKLWAEAFNRQNPPKKVDIFQLSVLELNGAYTHGCDPVDGGAGDSPSASVRSSCFYHVERYMEGEYRKYNSNSGFVDEQLRNTPQTATPLVRPRGAFTRRRAVSFSQSHVRGPSHGSRFGPTVARSTENMHHAFSRQPRRSSESFSFSSDDHPSSSAGFVLFNGSSLSNLLDPDKDETASIGPFTTLKLDTMLPDLHLSDSSGLAQQSFSLTSPLVISPNQTHFPRPVLAFEPFPVHLPRRTRDRAASGDSGYSGRTNLLSTGAVIDASSSIAATTAWSDASLSHSGLHTSGIINTTAVQPPPPPPAPLAVAHIDLSSATTLVHPGFSGGSVSSLVDYSVPASPIGPPVLFQHQFSMPGSSHSMQNSCANELMSHWASVGHWNHGWGHTPGVRVAPVLPRRRRNLSESSDLDFDEDYRVNGNLLHQLMHENHKPSCADHPTNLDQEIGQSILGQIHHELARLHEAGRFLPNCKGGWSHAGLGGLLLKNPDLGASDDPNLDSGNPNNDEMDDANAPDSHSPVILPEHSIDWSAVLFHERHAAQLGCLEAMIVMAHYYLGLPTQLMLDCPIKPNQSDLRSGVDYLGRAAEGGDRRCMILLARFLDVSASLSDPSHAVSKTTRPDDFLLLPALTSASRDAVPLISSDPWLEAITWYKKAVDTAGVTAPSDGAPDEGLDAEGRYDAAEDLLPVYRILARMAEMYSIGGFGLKQNCNMSGDLFNQAGELASAARQGRLAAKYFELSEEAYANCE
ncbi:unnamed protein product [Echinostoma caproni]|uniref:Alpha-type protein kinase domain-containing protein n=1 Tax=Echinostoma caproni TaxID=27848 RepID=A0A183AMB8_9TREM|nr:unnamed protein product [Echinostoma caproni]